MKIGCVNALLRAMEEHNVDANTQETAITALLYLNSCSEGRRNFVEARGLDIVHEALTNFKENTAIQQAGLNCLGAMQRGSTITGSL